MTDQATGGAPAPVVDATASQAPVTVDAVVGKPGSEAGSSPAATDSSDTAKPKKNGEDRRIDELTRRWREEQRRSDRLMRMLEERGQQPAPTQPQQSAPQGKKGLADFNYDAEKFAEYARKEAIDSARGEFKTVLQQEREALEFQQRVNAHDARVAKFRATVDDFDVQAARADMPFIHRDMADAILDSDESAAVEYYLWKNIEEAQAIAAMTPARAGRAIERIEQRLVAERKKASEKPVSQAPPPPPKIEGSDPGNVEKDPSKMTDAQFRKWRESTMARRR